MTTDQSEAFDAINFRTGFAAGERFASPAEVREYFRTEVLAECRPAAAAELPSQAELDAMANLVIHHGWWMTGVD